MRWFILCFAAWLLLIPADLRSEVTFFGPIPYRSLEDSPCYDSGNSQAFFVEDFEDGVASYPVGVEPYPGIINSPGPTTDSVDADDGVIDGWGNNGHSLTPTLGIVVPTNPPIWITHFGLIFDQQHLGHLPTCVGVVVTDGMPTSWVGRAIYDGNGVSWSNPVFETLFDDKDDGATTDDWFLGVRSTNGIRRFNIGHEYQSFTYEARFEIDHPQFSGQVPEPAAFSHAFIIVVAWVVSRRRFVVRDSIQLA